MGELTRRSVLHVIQPPDGGVAEHVYGLVLGLRDSGWNVAVATGTDSRISDPLRREGVALHELPLVRSVGADDLRAARALRRLDAQLRPDIVHAHSSKAGALVRVALPRARRLVYTPNCLAFLAGLGRRRLLYRVVEQALVPRSGAIVAVCEWERREAAHRLLGVRRRLEMVHNGVRLFPAAEPDVELVRFAGDRPLAGLVSVLRDQKDPLSLVRAVPLMPLDVGRIAIVGDGELRDVVAAEIDRLDVADRVRLFEYRGEMGPHLAALDVFVLPSAWEAFPLAILEAMRAGLPVVATKVGGVEEAVIDGVTGRTVPPRSPVALAKALTSLLSDGGMRRRMGCTGREHAERRFTVERTVEGIASIYEHALRKL